MLQNAERLPFKNVEQAKRSAEAFNIDCDRISMISLYEQKLLSKLSIEQACRLVLMQFAIAVYIFVLILDFIFIAMLKVS